MNNYKAILLAIGMLLGLSAPAFAATDVFLKIEGIDGESKDSNHDKWIDVLSIDWGAGGRAQDYNSSRSNNSSSRANHNTTRSNRAPLKDNGQITVRKRIDKSSPLLAKSLTRSSSGKSTPANFPYIYVDAVSEDGSIVHYKLIEVRVTRIDKSRSADKVPTETISMSYRTMVKVKAIPVEAGSDKDSAKKVKIKREKGSGMATGKR